MDFPETELKTNPQKKANPISKHLFLWIIPLFYEGYKKSLTLSDLYKPRQTDVSSKLGDKLERAWNDQLEKKKLGKIKSPSLLSALWKVFGGHYSALFILYIITECILRVSQPIFVRYLVKSFATDSDISERDQYLFAGGVILSTFLVTMFFHPSFHGGFIIAMRCRIACSSLIYRKSLRLSKLAQAGSGAGQLVNLLSNDVNRFDLNLLFFPYFLVAPIQLGIFTYFLWQEFGVSCLAGIAVVVIMTMLQYWNGKYSTEFRRDIAKRTDDRGRMMNEIITAIRVIKMYAWELPFTSLIQKLRKMEMNTIRKRSFLRGIYLSTFSSASKLVPFLTFLIFVLKGNEITADKVFFTVAVYNAIIQNMMYFVPSAISGLGEVWIALKRIEEYLALKEKNFSINHENLKETAKLSLKQATASWTGEKDHLSNINLEIEGKKLVIIVGTIGSGKTTLLHLLLEELDLKSGQFLSNKKISFASQEPFIFGGNVRQNILFGKPFDEKRYSDVIYASAMVDDLHQFEHGDMTIVGDRGVSLSGGQKARVNLARALYQDSEVYFLDDPLSAVDSKVSRHLFEKCVRGFLKEKLVILVTHQLQYLPQADHVVVMEEGKILAQGNFSELTHQGIDFVKLLTTESEETVEKENETVNEKKAVEIGENKKQVGNVEQVVQGGMGGTVYWKYFKTGNSYVGLFLLAAACILAQLSITTTEYWMSLWTNTEEKRRRGGESYNPDIYLGEDTYLSVYGGLVGLVLFFNLSRALGWFSYSYLISVNMHNSMFSSIVRAPTKFFDDNPPGRVMNRFTKDLGQMDEMLPPVFFETSIIFLQMIGVLGIVIASNWVIAIPAAVVLVLLWFMRGFFISTSRAIKRIEGMTKSPVFNHAVSSLQGLTTIRSSGTEKILIEQFDGLQDYHTSTWFLFLCSTRCFGIWVELVSILFLALVAFSFLLFQNGNEGGSVGLAITAAMNLTTWFQFAMRQSAEVSNYMTSVERTLEYVGLPPEANIESSPDKKPPKDWPNSGQILFQNVSLAYNEKLVLTRLSFEIHGNEKVAIVGRTGAGKSSIIQAMFRMTEPTGNIIIDGIEIQKIGLHNLRQQISIIPQDPTLFCGSIRYNLDPFEQFQDSELWRAVEESGLKDAIPSLDHKVEDGGSNFSSGQKQLICLARAILRNNKILILDEATANVDPTTDNFIQDTIRNKFKDCTIITIAHRLNSVMDCDRILVLEQGNIMEFDHPWVLLQKEDGILSSMVNSTGNASSALLRNMAEKSYQKQQ